MTVSAFDLSLPREVTGSIDRRALLRWVYHSAALAIAVLGAGYVAREGAGLASGSVLVGIVTMVPLFIAGAAWRLPWWLHVTAVTLPLSIIVVAASSSLGWFGADRAATYGCGALAFLAVAGWARSPRRRLIVALAVVLLVVDQYATAWFPWWGGGDANDLMFGTFYWHNQFAAYCLAGAAIGLALAVAVRGVVGVVGGLGVAFATAGVFASGSRAALILLVVVGIIGLVAALMIGALRGAVRWFLVVAASIGVSVLMSSALFFPSSSVPGSVALDRSEGGTLQSSMGARFEFWRVGAIIGLDNPVLGSGLRTFGPVSSCYEASSYSSNPHNEWVLSWAETGAVGLLPLLAVLVGSVVIGVRSIRRILATKTLAGDPGHWGGFVAAGVLVGHAAFDFDWSYPSLAVIAAMALGLTGAPVISAVPRRRRYVAVAVAASVVLLGASVIGFLADPLAGQPLSPVVFPWLVDAEVCARLQR